MSADPYTTALRARARDLGGQRRRLLQLLEDDSLSARDRVSAEAELRKVVEAKAKCAAELVEHQLRVRELEVAERLERGVVEDEDVIPPGVDAQ